MAVVAIGFEAAPKLADHFQLHGQEFSALSHAEYEELAVFFLNMPRDGLILECTRARDNDIIRFDVSTQVMAIMRKDGIIRTFFCPDPGWHGRPSNLDYFRDECAK